MLKFYFSYWFSIRRISSFKRFWLCNSTGCSVWKMRHKSFHLVLMMVFYYYYHYYFKYMYSVLNHMSIAYSLRIQENVSKSQNIYYKIQLTKEETRETKRTTKLVSVRHPLWCKKIQNGNYATYFTKSNWWNVCVNLATANVSFMLCNPNDKALFMESYTRTSFKRLVGHRRWSLLLLDQICMCIVYYVCYFFLDRGRCFHIVNVELMKQAFEKSTKRNAT